MGLFCLSDVPASAKTPLPPSESPFAAVFVDAKTEASRLGPFPYDRAVYAQALTILQAAGTKAVVLKYFIDIPKTPEGDQALAKAMDGIPVLLQASIFSPEEKPNPLPEEFEFRSGKGWPKDILTSDKGGWLPIPLLSSHAKDVGFVDFANPEHPENVPMAAVYKGRRMRSLWLSALQSAFDSQAQIAGRRLKLAAHSARLNEHLELIVDLPRPRSFQPASFIDLVDGKLDSRTLKGKIVVLGYVGKNAEVFKTPKGDYSAHELFFAMLEGAYRRLSRAK